ncbi:hypothetical protein CONLIGDRAFT_650609 [Coniochaeta ligniaria NRRL 30616]|uniref:Uncharacterized protein n=1 Tax=Coniochaeta ligniaria NRRL 30616 TaxID=1408157 RepID=A0A1J7IXR0_9PEZI|nr:hypothetical protein CONLIGDRAFT_650609 [Coniochaeta ligniaria NRRL 30616]
MQQWNGIYCLDPSTQLLPFAVGKATAEAKQKKHESEEDKDEDWVDSPEAAEDEDTDEYNDEESSRACLCHIPLVAAMLAYRSGRPRISPGLFPLRLLRVPQKQGSKAYKQDRLAALERLYTSYYIPASLL